MASVLACAMRAGVNGEKVELDFFQNFLVEFHFVYRQVLWKTQIVAVVSSHSRIS